MQQAVHFEKFDYLFLQRPNCVPTRRNAADSRPRDPPQNSTKMQTRPPRFRSLAARPDDCHYAADESH